MADDIRQPTEDEGASKADSSKQQRGRRKTRTGIVVSSNMNKTIVVRDNRIEQHTRYKKYLHRHSRFYAHDENGEATVGDLVSIKETRPLSKLKRWRLVSVLEKR
jgi:small subunit ribosomal protein S17